ncbi:MAG: Cysteine desulfurase [candidate division WWE3 bacterium GW2011_GWF2_41_45]|uniref:Cysteine desulfurase n=3 Tax=Katanobacteria TaxID=422282 RepID=A0A1F4VZ62_UNCKA|nr:MAG: Cysteine desulfurase [candidate division WWE3 bacterium GW2011_GWC2_41_23]KKS10411.1 MAG: Cysteine desulfurase [candidate division WWE3 bacterium GW2011_GWF2_41_45]KKS12039.1 MAG: Cysteine desulfurase [candidate division WWE3 bacterium GW2011_GWF1_41_53]KKS20061.1 MAG: Cysteine desulfurase [candidate division WWE3 bacterium GW2011_GWE1_41_72]KKS26599.1 MAG: Cysteine desulfurase [candidate division WWE3 bacterium GW2011_GWC1_42_102]KKS50673.1 MAG: Cysteine desulfurase [candidate divisio
MNIEKIKKDFPILERKIGLNDLVYLDNTATTQKPLQVVEALKDYYFQHNANIHRGIHTLSEEASEMYDNARKTVAQFINAIYPEEIIFTRGATESLNMAAFSWGIPNLKKGDKILLTGFEHHSNLIPWQIVAKNTGAELKFVKIGSAGIVDMTEFKNALTPDVKLVCVAHASNVLGTILDIKEISKMAHAVGALVCVDGAQAVPHMPVNVQSLGCDFYSFSGHKMLGPTGIGVLYVKKSVMGQMVPFQFGGGMIKEVSLTDASWADAPEKFEAGTPDAAGAIGLAAAIDYLTALGMDKVREHEIELGKYAIEKLTAIEGIKILGPLDPEKRTGLISFYSEKVHAHDIASVLNSFGVAVRSGHHCAMPLHKELGLPATVRASYYIYNDFSDIDKLAEGVKKALTMLS